MKLALIFITLAFEAITTLCETWDPATDCLDGITSDITSFIFGDVEPGSYYATMCNGTLSTTSLWAAAKVYCSDLEIAAGEKLVGGWCIEYGETSLRPYSEVEPLLTDAFISSLPIVEYEDIATAQTWNTSILLSRNLFIAGYKTSVRVLCYSAASC